MGYWDGAAPNLIYDSIVELYANDAIAWEEELERYADYRDGRSPAVKKYFKKRKRETEERFQDRPKISVPLCRLGVDVHAEALAKEVQITFEDPKTAEEWELVSEHNGLDAFWMKLASTLGTFGHGIARPLLHNDGTPQKVLEFDSFSPLQSRLIFESNTAGRSVPHFQGVTMFCGYSLENGSTLPWPVKAEMLEQLKVKQRIEYISKDRWLVWLDGKLTAESPWGDVWMPDADGGTNPYKFIPAVLFNGLETEEQRLGISDIHEAVYDVQAVNEIWSDTVYMHRMYVPVAVLKTKNEESAAIFKSGIGVGVRLGSGADEDFYFTSAAVDFKGVLEPMAVAMEIALANMKTPAMSVGMGHLFGSQAKSASAISGVSKAFEWKPTVRHATQKRFPFKRAIVDLVRQSLQIMALPPPYGQGKSVKPDTTITVEFPADIVPSSAAENLERLTKEVLGGFTSLYEGMVKYHKWSPERAQREMDMRAAENKAHLVEIGFKEIVELVQERQKATVDVAALEKAKAKLFKGSAVLGADTTAESDEDEPQQGGGKK